MISNYLLIGVLLHYLEEMYFCALTVIKIGLFSMLYLVFEFECKSCQFKQCPYLPTPPLGQDMIQGQFLSEV